MSHCCGSHPQNRVRVLLQEFLTGTVTHIDLTDPEVRVELERIADILQWAYEAGRLKQDVTMVYNGTEYTFPQMNEKIRNVQDRDGLFLAALLAATADRHEPAFREAHAKSSS